MPGCPILRSFTAKGGMYPVNQRAAALPFTHRKQSRLNLHRTLPRHPQHLCPIRSPTHQIHPPPRHPQSLRKKLNQRLISLPIHRRSRQRNLHRTRMKPGHRIPASPRMQSNHHRASIPNILRKPAKHVHHALTGYTRFPNKAVPTRTHVLPSSIATAKSPDIPIDNCTAPGYRASASSRNRRNSLK